MNDCPSCEAVGGLCRGCEGALAAEAAYYDAAAQKEKANGA